MGASASKRKEKQLAISVTTQPRGNGDCEDKSNFQQVPLLLATDNKPRPKSSRKHARHRGQTSKYPEGANHPTPCIEDSLPPDEEDLQDESSSYSDTDSQGSHTTEQFQSGMSESDEQALIPIESLTGPSQGRGSVIMTGHCSYNSLDPVTGFSMSTVSPLESSSPGVFNWRTKQLSSPLLLSSPLTQDSLSQGSLNQTKPKIKTILVREQKDLDVCTVTEDSFTLPDVQHIGLQPKSVIPDIIKAKSASKHVVSPPKPPRRLKSDYVQDQILLQLRKEGVVKPSEKSEVDHTLRQQQHLQQLRELGILPPESNTEDDKVATDEPDNLTEKYKYKPNNKPQRLSSVVTMNHDHDVNC